MLLKYQAHSKIKFVTKIFPRLRFDPAITTIDVSLQSRWAHFTGRHLAGSVVENAGNGGVCDSQTGLLWISEQAAGAREENFLANRLVEAVLRIERRCVVFLRRRECREGVRCRLPSWFQSAQQRAHLRWQEARVRIAATRPHAEELHLRHGIRDGQETVIDYYLLDGYFYYRRVILVSFVIRFMLRFN